MNQSNKILATVQSYLRIKSAANKEFGDIATIEQGWQILLYLFSNHLKGSPTKYSEIRKFLGYPESNTNRCLQYHQARGFVVVREGSEPDREINVRLSDHALAKLETIFADA